jgi:hypothetical protein
LTATRYSGCALAIARCLIDLNTCRAAKAACRLTGLTHATVPCPTSGIWTHSSSGHR